MRGKQIGTSRNSSNRLVVKELRSVKHLLSNSDKQLTKYLKRLIGLIQIIAAVSAIWFFLVWIFEKDLRKESNELRRLEIITNSSDLLQQREGKRASSLTNRAAKLVAEEICEVNFGDIRHLELSLASNGNCWDMDVYIGETLFQNLSFTDLEVFLNDGIDGNEVNEFLSLINPYNIPELFLEHSKMVSYVPFLSSGVHLNSEVNVSLHGSQFTNSLLLGGSTIIKIPFQGNANISKYTKPKYGFGMTGTYIKDHNIQIKVSPSSLDTTTIGLTDSVLENVNISVEPYCFVECSASQEIPNFNLIIDLSGTCGKNVIANFNIEIPECVFDTDSHFGQDLIDEFQERFAKIKYGNQSAEDLVSIVKNKIDLEHINIFFTEFLDLEPQDRRDSLVYLNNVFLRTMFQPTDAYKSKLLFQPDVCESLSGYEISNIHTEDGEQFNTTRPKKIVWDNSEVSDFTLVPDGCD